MNILLRLLCVVASVLSVTYNSLADTSGFTGQDWDGTSHLSYMRMRCYDPDTGTFLSKDPIGISGRNHGCMEVKCER